MPFPTSPSWGYRVTQGLHVITGTAAVPLLLVKLWIVYPKLFAAAAAAGREACRTALERGSIAVLVASAIFQLATGLAQRRAVVPLGASRFRTTHYALAWVAIGALVVHIAVKLPIDPRRAAAPTSTTPPTTGRRAPSPGRSAARGLLRTGRRSRAGVAVLATAGNTVPALRRVVGPRRPVRRRARRHPDQQVRQRGRRRRRRRAAPPTGSSVVHGDRTGRLTRDDLRRHGAAHPDPADRLRRGLERLGRRGPASGSATCSTWSAPRAAATCGSRRSRPSAPSADTVLPANFADDDRTLLALALDGEPLAIDHGYPCRLIAPNRPGVLQTKWVSRLEVLG